MPARALLLAAAAAVAAAQDTAPPTVPCTFNTPFRGWTGAAPQCRPGAQLKCQTSADCAGLPGACCPHYGPGTASCAGLSCVRDSLNSTASFCGTNMSAPGGGSGVNATPAGQCRTGSAAPFCAFMHSGPEAGNAMCASKAECEDPSPAISLTCFKAGHAAPHPSADSSVDPGQRGGGAQEDTAATVGTMMVVPPTKGGGLYFSEHNWAMESTGGAAPVAVSVNSGAYVKAVFRGSTHASFVLQPTKPSSSSGGANEEEEEEEAASTHYMNVVYSIDNKPWVEVPIFGNTTEIIIPYAEINATVTHTLQLQIYNSLQGANRWSSPAKGGAALALKGLVLDRGAQVLPPTLLPRRAIFFGDSITEGVNAECRNTPESVAKEGGGVAGVPGDVPEPGGDLSANSATKTWGPTVAAALGAEYSQIGFGSLGWVVSGAGGVPAFYVPGKDAVNSWDKHYDTAKRSFENLDYIFVGHATNDGLREGSKATASVTAAVTGWLGAARAAAGPKTAIFLCVPFGSFGAANEPKGSLKAGFDAYQAKAHDARAYYIDLGREAALGLECGSWERGCVGAFGSQAGPSMQGCDGIHPRGGTHAAARHGELGAQLAVAAALAMANHTL